MQGKSKDAFSHNVAAEMNAGKPRAQSLAIAYAIKKKNAKKMAHGGMMHEEDEDHEPKMHHMAEGGMVQNEKLHPSHEAHVKSIVEDFFKSHMEHMARGGMVEEEDPSEEMEEMSASGDNFLSHDNDYTDKTADDMMPEGFNESEDGSSEMEEKRKKILQAIVHRW